MNKVAYAKVAFTYRQQLQQLLERGLHVPDEDFLLHLLEVKSYYRLSGYWYPLLQNKEEHIFKKGASFDTSYKIYCFDRELRHLVLEELEKIEVAIRAKMIYVLSHKHGPFWYQQVELFKNQNSLNRQLGKLEIEYKRSDEEFVRCFSDKYNNSLPPSWMLLEVSSFGSLSVLYSNLKPSLEKREIAKYFGLSDSVFSSWLHSIVYLRNVCAHHSRLWNRAMCIQPTIPRNPKYSWLNNKPKDNKNTYFILSILVYLMNRVKCENDAVERIKALFEKYPNIYPPAMGFPTDWESEPIWNSK